MKAAYWIVLLGMVSCVNRGVISGEETGEASLSEIVEDVVAIALETNEQCKLGEIDVVKHDGGDFFLLSNRRIYRFNWHGIFLNQMNSNKITGISSIRNFAVNPQRKQVFAIDSFCHVLTYSYDGVLLNIKDLRDKPWKNLLDIAYYDNHLWATVEKWISSPSDKETKIEKWLYQMDMSFNVKKGMKLCQAKLNRFHLSGDFKPTFCVFQDRFYTYTTSYEPEMLLADTLTLIEHNRLEESLCSLSEGTTVSMLPLRIGKRFLLASNRMNGDENRYFFCYDRTEHRAFRLRDGFTDDFFQTGKVSDLQALDIYNREFYYYKSGQSVRKAFPERKTTDNPMLFWVHLKT